MKNRTGARARPSITTLLVTLGLASLTLGQGLAAAPLLPLELSTPRPSLDETTERTFTFFHVFGRKSETERLPAALKPYRAGLAQTGLNHFEDPQVKKITLTLGKTTKLALPRKLGTAEITLLAKEMVSVRLLDPKGKTVGKYELPASKNQYILNQKLRTGGLQYLLIRAKTKP